MVTTTDQNGVYRFTVSGAAVQDDAGYAVGVSLHASTPARSGAGTLTLGTGFYPVNTTTSLPTARFWDPVLRVEEDAEAITLRFDQATPPPGGSGPAYRFSASRGTGEATWSQAVSPGTRLDTRIFEDVTSHVAVSARWGKDGFAFSLTGAGTQYVGTRGAPPSRGAACKWKSGLTREAPQPCPVTDGAFSTAREHDPHDDVDWVAVDLGDVRPLHLLVARGGAGQSAQASLDGILWLPVPGAWSDDGEDANGVFTPYWPVPARHVRLGGSLGSALPVPRELSIW